VSVVFGFFKKQEQFDEEPEFEPVVFLGPVNGKEVNLKAYGRLIDAGLVPAKDLITDALARRAEVIRVEPKGTSAAVALVVDGIAYPGHKLPKQEALAIVQMVKLLAGLDVKERKKPQRGGIKAEFENRKYELTVESIPVADGERLIVRAIDQKDKRETASEIGMSDDMKQRIRDVSIGTGVLIVVGPSNSGVTTTLYALVRNVDSYIYTVMTVGDTQGRHLHHVSALEPQEGEDLNAKLVRAARREANVILCDPLIDAAMAKTLFAHHEAIMLMTEMKAKDTPGGLKQLVEWVGKPALVAEGLRGIVTQKLIRKLCPDCKQAYRPKSEFLKSIGLPSSVSTLYRRPSSSEDSEAVECEKCGGSGFLGRTGMFEFLEMSEGMKEMVLEKAEAPAIRAQMKKDKMTTLQQDGLRLVAAGITSLEELQRVFKPTA
jgi:type II secretory ATPase GspE/PulE/Tfp pilus assembly ATPase PilB-like protein